MHTCECPGRAHSTAIRATLGCMDRDDDAHGKTHGRVRLAETGVGIGGTNPHLKHARWNGDSALFAAVRYYRCLPQRITRGSNGLRTVIHTPTARPPQNADDCEAKLKRLAERQEEAAPPHLHAARQCVRARHPTRICVRVVAFPTPGRREPDAARWTQRPGPHPCRDMCGTALRGACAPDIRRATELTHWPRLAASK